MRLFQLQFCEMEGSAASASANLQGDAPNAVWPIKDRDGYITVSPLQYP